MKLLRHWRPLAAAAAIALCAAAPAQAQSIARALALGNWAHAAGGPFQIPAMQSPAFANAANQPFVVTFTSECSVNAAAGNFIAYTDIDLQVWTSGPAGIFVTTLAPTAGNADAFCAANGTVGFDGMAMHSVTAFGGPGLPAGIYSVRAVSRTNGGAMGGMYGERTLNVAR